MSYQVPTLQDLLDRTRKMFRAALPGSDAWIWPNNITPTAKVVAGAVFEVFGFAAYIAKMIFVHTAPDLDTLKKHAAEFGMAQRPAYPASGTVTVTSTGDLSASIGAILVRSDGAQYVVGTAASRSGAGTLDVTVTAVTDGADGNALDGTPLELLSGFTDENGDATAEASGDIIGGADVEDIETFRARILFRKRYPPHGGAASDYVQWATDVIGVTRVWVERLWAGSGSVRVFVLMDDLYANGIPTTDAVERVADYIETLRPAGALVTVAAPSPVTVNITISGLSPNTTAVQEAVKTSLREAFRRLSVVAGADSPHGGMPFLAVPATFSRSWIWQAIANATGEERHVVDLPAADVTLTAGQIAVLGSITFV